MAKHIDRKLRVTAIVLGTVTMKDLGAAFRHINPATAFDIDRAHKWMQGRASPRQVQIYDDWAKVLDLREAGSWIAEVDAEAFIEVVALRHNRDANELRQKTEAPNGHAARPDRGPELAGTYACYSHAWSPYFRGRKIRGELSIGMGSSAKRLKASYAEALPTGRLHLEGPVSIEKRAIHLDLRAPAGDAHFVYFLMPPTPLVSVLVGLMCGATIIGPSAQPSVTRIAMVRLPASIPRLRTAEAYLPIKGSIAEDLVSLGLPISDVATVDRRFDAFFAERSGLDQVADAEYHPLVDALDQAWLRFPGSVGE
ncbi:hypothetical protein [Mesorhizobium sp. CN2-181]|uniref:hypothetical protein n=1 Tax=Mesorhizobium yinganensis TaxID=3157707 RepID=UPI0032B7C425